MAVFSNLSPELFYMITDDLHPQDNARLSLVSSYLDTMIQPLWPTLLQMSGVGEDISYTSRLELSALLRIRPSLARYIRYFDFLWCSWKYYHFAGLTQDTFCVKTFQEDYEAHEARMLLASGEGYNHVTERGACPSEQVGREVFCLLPLLSGLTTIKIKVCCYSNTLRDGLIEAVSGSRGWLLWPELSTLTLSQCHLVGHRNARTDHLILSFLARPILKDVTVGHPVQLDKRLEIPKACNLKCLNLHFTNMAFHIRFPAVLARFNVLRELTICLRSSKTRKSLGSAQVLADALATIKGTLEKLYILIGSSKLSPISAFMKHFPKRKQLGSLQDFKRLRALKAPIQLLLWSPLDEVGENLTDGRFLPTLFRHILPPTLETLRLQEIGVSTIENHRAAFRDLFRYKKKFPALKFISIYRAFEKFEEGQFVQLEKEAEAAGISFYEEDVELECFDH